MARDGNRNRPLRNWEARRETHAGATLALKTYSPVDVILAAEVMADWLGAARKCDRAMVLWAAASGAREDLDFPRQPWDDAWISR